MKIDKSRTGRSLFEEDVAEGPPLIAGLALTSDQDARLVRVLPPAFFDLLRAQGFATLKSRKYQFLDPADFTPLVSQMFAGDPQIDPEDVHVTGCTAFGTFDLWSGSHFAMKLTLDQMHLSCQTLAPPEFTGPAELMAALKGNDDNPLALDPDNLARALLPDEPKEIDFWDVMNKPVFKRACAEFGDLTQGEIFAFDPPLAAMPGVRPRQPLERMARTQAYAALEASMAVAPLQLVKFAMGRMTPIRRIGP